MCSLVCIQAGARRGRLAESVLVWQTSSVSFRMLSVYQAALVGSRPQAGLILSADGALCTNFAGVTTVGSVTRSPAILPSPFEPQKTQGSSLLVFLPTSIVFFPDPESAGACLCPWGRRKDQAEKCPGGSR